MGILLIPAMANMSADCHISNAIVVGVCNQSQTRAPWKQIASTYPHICSTAVSKSFCIKYSLHGNDICNTPHEFTVIQTHRDVPSQMHENLLISKVKALTNLLTALINKLEYIIGSQVWWVYIINWLSSNCLENNVFKSIEFSTSYVAKW